jgi:O-antigen/teichoic acid export membrane protein
MGSTSTSRDRFCGDVSMCRDSGRLEEAEQMSIGRNTAYNLVGSAIPLVLALATVPLYIKLVGPDRYGVLAIAWVLLGYFGLFDLGLGRATTYQIAALKDASDEARASVFWSAVIINLGMGIVGGAVLWLCSHYFFSNLFKVDGALRDEVLSSISLLAFAVPIATLTGVLSGALMGRGQFLWTNMVSITSTSLFQIFPLAVAWWFGPNLWGLLLAAISARVVAIVVLWLRCYYTVARRFSPRFDRSQARALLGYGGWVALTSLVAPALVMVDRFAIGAVIGAAAVAIYTIPFQLAQRIAIVPIALMNALFPRLPTASPEERDTLSNRATETLASALGGPTLVAILLLHPFLNLWVGPTLGDQAAMVGRLLVFGFWINAFAVVPYSRMQASGRPDMVVKVYAFEILIYLALLYFCMKNFGLVGCAIALILRNIADYCLLSYQASGSIRNPRLLLSYAGLLCAGLALAARAAYDSPVWWAVVLIALVAMTVLSWATLPQELKLLVRNSVAAWTARRPRQAE